MSSLSSQTKYLLDKPEFPTTSSMVRSSKNQYYPEVLGPNHYHVRRVLRHLVLRASHLVHRQRPSRDLSSTH